MKQKKEDFFVTKDQDMLSVTYQTFKTVIGKIVIVFCFISLVSHYVYYFYTIITQQNRV